MKTCTVDGCAMPHRARGLCSTHYNRANKRLVATPCARCGTVVLKEPTSKYANRFCDLDCRDEWRWWNEKPLACPVPARATRHVPHLCRWITPVAFRSCVQFQRITRVGNVSFRRRIRKRERRAREYGATGSFTWDSFMRLALSLGNACAYCGGDNDGEPFEPDHVMPLSKGGHNGLTNILPACRYCNGSKGSQLPDEWVELCKRRGLSVDLTRFTHLTARATVSIDPDHHAA